MKARIRRVQLSTELLILYTSQLNAICCIHVPISEMPCPTKKGDSFCASMHGMCGSVRPISYKT